MACMEVSSNPTNLVLAGAFSIPFINYTANIIVPVVVTAILMLPFLLFIVFPYEPLIPKSVSNRLARTQPLLVSNADWFYSCAQDQVT
jgi:Na+/H+ antiporter NhaD/arsenite permease-like protein